MGTEAVWIPMAIAAVGAGASAYNTYQTGRNQDRALAASIQQQQVRQREADALVRAQLERTGQSTPDAERQTAMQEYLTQIQRAQAQAEGGLGVMGDVSARYAGDAGSAGQAIRDYATGTADIYSRIDAPLRQREREGIEFSRLGSDINTLGMLSGSDQYLADLRLRRAGQRNPWIDAFSQAAQGYAGGMSDSGWGSVSSTPAYNKGSTPPGKF